METSVLLIPMRIDPMPLGGEREAAGSSCGGGAAWTTPDPSGSRRPRRGHGPSVSGIRAGRAVAEVEGQDLRSVGDQYLVAKHDGVECQEALGAGLHGCLCSHPAGVHPSRRDLLEFDPRLDLPDVDRPGDDPGPSRRAGEGRPPPIRLARDLQPIAGDCLGEDRCIAARPTGEAAAWAPGYRRVNSARSARPGGCSPAVRQSHFLAATRARSTEGSGWTSTKGSSGRSGTS